MIEAMQLRNLITDVLEYHGLHSKTAVELLMLTAAQESFCGKYIKQLRGGPALGIFQMEPATYDDLWNNYLVYRDHLASKVREYNVGGALDIHMRGNIPFQILTARLYYLRFRERLPEDHQNVYSLARYYKKYWNTELGAANIHQAAANYFEYAF